MTALKLDDWIDCFPELRELSEPDRGFLGTHTNIVRLPEGQAVFAPGAKPDGFLLIFEGTVRVQQTAPNGREIILYRVSAGESCVMTTTCLLADESYLAEGVTETPVTAVVINKADFDEFMGRSPAFRRLVFAKYAARMADLQKLVEDVAFERLDKRLALKLLELTADGGDLETTHHTLATELGTAREVISRLLKEIAKRGWIDTGRGYIRIVDRAALVRFADDG